MSTFTPLLAQLKHAVKLAEQIESLQAELVSTMRDYCSGLNATSTTGHKTFRKAPLPQPSPSPGEVPEPRVNRVSPEGRAKIAEAQKRRWAKWRQA